MKKNRFKFILILIIAIVIISVTIYYFVTPKYVGDTRIFFSTDKGQTYKEGPQELKVNESYYLAVEMQVFASMNFNTKRTAVFITIPNTKIVDIFIEDYYGDPVDGEVFFENGNEVNQFNLTPSVEPFLFRIIFECISSTPGTSTLSIVYDKKVPKKYDNFETINYIESKEENLNYIYKK